MKRVFALLILVLFSHDLHAITLGYEEVLLGDTRKNVVNIINNKYSNYRVEEKVDERFGIPAIVISILKQGRRYEISLEFNYKDILNHINVVVYGMKDGEYSGLLDGLQAKYGSPDEIKTFEKPNMFWKLDKNRYEMQVSHWGDYVQIEYWYYPNR